MKNDEIEMAVVVEVAHSQTSHGDAEIGGLAGLKGSVTIS